MIKAKLDKHEVIISKGVYNDIYKPLKYEIVSEKEIIKSNEIEVKPEKK